MIRRVRGGLWACAILAAASFAFAQQAPIKQKEKSNCALPEVLWALGKKYDVYFTIEHAGRAVETQSMIWTIGIYAPWTGPNCNYLHDGSTDINQELLAIQRDLPDLGYVIDSRNHRIVHVYDRAADSQPGYPMSKVLAPFQFKGTEAGLVHSLYKAGILVSFSYNGQDTPVDSDGGEASRTRVDINTQSATVREILSSYEPADRQQRIMWIAVITNPTPPPSTVGLHVGYRWSKDHVVSR